MSLWIESHQSLLNHPKTHAAANRLKVTRPTMVGHLHCLWWWCLDYAQDGDVTGYDDQTLAAAALWEGDTVAFVEALVNCGIRDGAGFLERTEDGRMFVHDWDEYAGKLIQKRKADAERKRCGSKPPLQQNKHPPPSEIQRSSVGVPVEVAGTNHTNQPHLTNQTATAPARAIVHEYDEVVPRAAAAHEGLLSWEMGTSMGTPFVKTLMEHDFTPDEIRQAIADHNAKPEPTPIRGSIPNYLAGIIRRNRDRKPYASRASNRRAARLEKLKERTQGHDT